MRLRQQLPIAPTISLTDVAAAVVDVMRRSNGSWLGAHALLRKEFGADQAMLTDSGTSALVLAMRLAVPGGGTIGLPEYACFDLSAAALLAGLRVRLYDTNPTTLSADLDSVKAMLERGVDALIAVHLFGYATDVPAIRRLAEPYGVVVIEDAAQAAAGRLNGQRLGTLGELSVLSFGRGKGLSAGGGGALLSFGERWQDLSGALEGVRPSTGFRRLAGTAAQAVFGRPWLYGIPAAIPWLHLGEMVDRVATEPAPIARAESALLEPALKREKSELEGRARRARQFEAAARRAPGMRTIEPISGADPGYLRFPIRALDEKHLPAPEWGVLRPYPCSMVEHERLGTLRVSGEPLMIGARELRRSLFVVPTHRFVGESDARAIDCWMRAATK
ncbi:MAG TPA: DegT/DnrJ/EryC1/StrS family aminotransferase [Gemmatimonadaceae bacterium]|nr:DegT/DnrJ/EryC1/StrS family aminotransferase [Gemmatimonadaceae bacterium]